MSNGSNTPTLEFRVGPGKDSRIMSIGYTFGKTSYEDDCHRLGLNLIADKTFSMFDLSVRDPGSIVGLNGFYLVQAELSGQVKIDDWKTSSFKSKYCFDDGKLVHAFSDCDLDFYGTSDYFKPVKGWFLTQAIFRELCKNDSVGLEIRQNIEPLVELPFEDLKTYWDRHYVDKL
jgi:hypothetical protein